MTGQRGSNIIHTRWSKAKIRVIWRSGAMWSTVFLSSLIQLTVKSVWTFCYSHGEYIQCVHRAPHHLEVVLENGDGAGQRLMSAAAEQSHARVEQDGGYEGRVWNPTKAFDAALQASLTQRKWKESAVSQQRQKQKEFSHWIQEEIFSSE